ncbi:MAG: HAD-IC family P-type ATPase [Candidatus Riflebacteria bacterium]|nr:HAD-IC family P-type ATPase [Candidatus Riflebacteria bacterium]
MERISWHSLPPAEVALRLATDAVLGVTPQEAGSRQERYGRNELSPPLRVPAWRRFLGQFENPLVIILLVSAVASALAGRGTDALVILAVTIVNAIIGFVQEMKAQGAIDALAKMVKTECAVRRGVEQPVRMSAIELVPGDVVLLATGDRVPADLRLVEAKNLRINESALTGESLPVEKTLESAPADAAVGDRRCLAFNGTLVTAGTGRGVVVETGDRTEIGRINALMNEAEELDTPLVQRLEQFSKVFGAYVLGFGVLIFVVGILRGMDKTEMFMAAVSAAVGAIPEGLPAVMTIVLAIGVKNMAARQAIIRKLPAVETLGSVTVICSDKTGTLTANEMTIQTLLCPSGRFSVEGVGFNPTLGRVYAPGDRDPVRDEDFARLMHAGVLCNDSQLRMEPHGWVVEGDPTEGALLTVAAKAGFDTAAMRAAHPRLDVLPFDSANQIMVTLNRDPGGKAILWVKGSVERLLGMCDRFGFGGQPLPAASIQAQVQELARQGMRVLALAAAPGEGLAQVPEKLPPLAFLGLVAMIDPPRAEVRDALAVCRKAGIGVKMITGDHPETAAAIARDLGIGEAGVPPLTGRQLGEMPLERFAEEAHRTAVFARVAPEHKFRLVEALQKRGDIVAMTGDGVNDAPALKRAEIGVAMGLSGTEVAKDASDMLLVDDNFATLVRAVEEGRNVFNNLVKSMVYILPTNTAQGLVVLFAILFGFRLPVTPVQILWVNLLTAFLSLPLAFEARESGLMDRPPRRPDEPLIEGWLLVRIVVVALWMTLVSFVIFWYERRIMMADVEVARTGVVTTMVLVELFYLFPARGLWSPMPNVAPALNIALWPCLLGTVALQLAFTYVPVLQRIMESRPIDLDAWLVNWAAAASIIPIIETLKRWTMPTSNPGPDAASLPVPPGA